MTNKITLRQLKILEKIDKIERMRTYTLRTNLELNEINDLLKGKADIAEWEDGG